MTLGTAPGALGRRNATFTHELVLAWRRTGARGRFLLVAASLAIAGFAGGAIADENEPATTLASAGASLAEEYKLHMDSIVPSKSAISMALLPDVYDEHGNRIQPEEGDAGDDAAEEVVVEPKTWKLEIDLGFILSQGNTDEVTLTFAILFKNETEKNRLTIDATYFLGTSDGVIDDNKFTSGVRYDWINLSPRWFAFAQARFDYDEFESWEERLAAHAGPGFQAVKSEKVVLDLLVGLGTRKEIGSLNDGWKPEGLFGVDFRWNPNEKNSFALSATYYPVLSDIEDFRTRETMRYRYKFSEAISLVISILHEHQSIVNPGSDPNDFRLTVGLGFDF